MAEGKQEGIQQGKLEAVSRMLELGWELETIAQCLDLPLQVVKEQANNRSRPQSNQSRLRPLQFRLKQSRSF